MVKGEDHGCHREQKSENSKQKKEGMHDKFRFTGSIINSS